MSRRRTSLLGLVSLSALTACGQEVVHVMPPFTGDGYMVVAGPGAVRTIEKARLGVALTFPETNEGESVFLVTFVESEVAALHPEAVLSDPNALELRVSSLTPKTCPFGEAPGPNRRRYALPSSTWQIFAFEGDHFVSVPDGPEWRASLRLEMPVAQGCGLESTALEPVPSFPRTSSGGFDHLIQITPTRWVGISSFGHSLVLIDTYPPRVVDEIHRAADLGLNPTVDALDRVQVDLERSPPVVLLASPKGLFRFRIEGDELVLHDRQWPENDISDIELAPSGRVVGVSAEGLVFTATRSDARTFEATEPLGPLRLEKVRATGVSGTPYLIVSKGGRGHLGDPFERPEALRLVAPSTRTWEGLALRPQGTGVLIHVLDAAGDLIRVTETEDVSIFRVGSPPEAPDCSGPTVDVCGFGPTDSVTPRSVVLLDQAGDAESRLLAGFQHCPLVLIVDPARGCLSHLDRLPSAQDQGTRWPTVTDDGILYLGLDGQVYRWSNSR